jgi:predicted outer membrane repeat protein
VRAARVLLALIGLASTSGVTAATIAVTNTNDNLAGSLRQAINDAAPGDTIVFNIPTTDARYNAFFGEFAIILTTGELNIAKNLTIEGGSSRISIRRDSGAGNFRIFNVTAGVVTLSKLMIQEGRPASVGGGNILNAGNLTVRGCTIWNGGVGSLPGGGIRNSGTLTVINSTFAINIANEGAGIYNDPSGRLVVRSSTIVENRQGGGGIGEGIANVNGTARVGNTIVVGNNLGSTPNDVRGAFISEGYNLIGNSSNASGFTATGDQVGATLQQANLGPLRDGGGVTPTLKPQPGSVAIDQGKRGVDGIGAAIDVDQRGAARPVDRDDIPNAVGGDGSDIGAVEVEPAQSGPVFVVNTKFHPQAGGGDGACTTVHCTLFEAIQASNAAPDANTIEFAPGVRGTILLNGFGHVPITNPVAINGPGADFLTLDRSNVSDRVFTVSSANVSLSGMTIIRGRQRDGNAIHNSGGLTLTDCVLTDNFHDNIPPSETGRGGAIYNAAGASCALVRCTLARNRSAQRGGAIFNASSATMTLENCTLTENRTTLASGSGGAIANDGTLTLRNCTISASQTALNGGAIEQHGAAAPVAATLENCTVSGNSAANAGGGIYTLAPGGRSTLNVTNCTFSQNTSPYGGAIYNDGNANGNAQLTLTNCTFDRNSATFTGGAIYNDAHNPDSVGTATVTLRNTLFRSGASGENLANDSFGHPGGTITSQGSNLSDDPAGAGGGTAPGGFLNAAGDKRNTDPQLATLQNNGGPTETAALQPNSPAIDAGNDAYAPPRDQRGYLRAGTSDIGAFEFGGVAPTPSPTPSPTPPTRLANISTRLRVETGDNVLIGGFIVTGSMQKRIIVRALAPSLQSIAPEERLPDPVLELYRGNELIATNDNWQEAPNRQEIVDSTIPPPNDLESAILQNVDLGAYTAIVRGAADGQGIGIVEVYDLGSNQDSKLANISTRGRVLTGNNVMIGGLIITGSSPQRVILRAIGPSLPVQDRLDDPLLQLFDANANLITSNNNWKDTQRDEIEATTIPPSHDLESAIVTSLSPGGYTAVVRGVDGITGVALVEAYALQ